MKAKVLLYFSGAVCAALLISGCGGDSSSSGSSSGTRCSDGGLLTVNAVATGGAVAQDECVLYRFSGTAGSKYTVILMTTAGDADLGVASDSRFTDVIGISAKGGLVQDDVTFVAAANRTYHILVSGFAASTFNIEVDSF